MKKRLLVLFSLSLVFTQSSAMTDPLGAFDFRLSLGDEIQEKRTTSINWPETTRVKKAEPPALTPSETFSAEPRAFRVMVDVGHGGHDYGAPGYYGLLEKNICLAIARYLKTRLERTAKLQEFALDVRLSRESDHFLPLRDRVKEANEWAADLFVSIHANSSPVSRARGFEVYFLSNEATDEEASRIAQKENGEAATKPLSKGVLSILSDLRTNTHIIESSRFAESVYSSLAQRLRPNGKGVRQAPFTVLHGTQMPALLIEVGYLTHFEEARALSKAPYQRRIAEGVAEGVLDFAQRIRRLSKSPSLRSAPKRTT